MSVLDSSYYSKKHRAAGFTIVELLIVVVVIGILAAITIVSYNGISSRAKSTAALSLAKNVEKKAEAYRTMQGSYPENATEFNSIDISNLGGLTISTSVPTDEKSVRYVRCPSNPSLPITGAQIIYKTFPGSGTSDITLGTCS